MQLLVTRQHCWCTVSLKVSVWSSCFSIRSWLSLCAHNHLEPTSVNLSRMHPLLLFIEVSEINIVIVVAWIGNYISYALWRKKEFSERVRGAKENKLWIAVKTLLKRSVLEIQKYSSQNTNYDMNFVNTYRMCGLFFHLERCAPFPNNSMPSEKNSHKECHEEAISSRQSLSNGFKNTLGVDAKSQKQRNAMSSSVFQSIYRFHFWPNKDIVAAQIR